MHAAYVNHCLPFSHLLHPRQARDEKGYVEQRAMKRKFGLSLGHLRIAPRASEKQLHDHVADRCLSPPASPLFERQAIPPVVEAQLKAACAAVARNYDPDRSDDSDRYQEIIIDREACAARDEALRRERRSTKIKANSDRPLSQRHDTFPADYQRPSHVATGASRVLHSARKSQQDGSFIKPPPLSRSLSAGSSRPAANTAKIWTRDDISALPLRRPELLPTLSADEAEMALLHEVARSDPPMIYASHFSDSTTSTSNALIDTRTSRLSAMNGTFQWPRADTSRLSRSRLYKPISATGAASASGVQPAEWMRQQLQKRDEKATKPDSQNVIEDPILREKPSAVLPGKGRSRSRDSIMRFARGSFSESRALLAPSKSASGSATPLPHNVGAASAGDGCSAFSRGWRSWGFPRRASFSQLMSRRPSLGGGGSGLEGKPAFAGNEGEQAAKRSLNLNRALPPLPGLDKWKSGPMTHFESASEPEATESAQREGQELKQEQQEAQENVGDVSADSVTRPETHFISASEPETQPEPEPHEKGHQQQQGISSIHIATLMKPDSNSRRANHKPQASVSAHAKDLQGLSFTSSGAGAAAAMAVAAPYARLQTQLIDIGKRAGAGSRSTSTVVAVKQQQQQQQQHRKRLSTAAATTAVLMPRDTPSTHLSYYYRDSVSGAGALQQKQQQQQQHRRQRSQPLMSAFSRRDEQSWSAARGTAEERESMVEEARRRQHRREERERERDGGRTKGKEKRDSGTTVGSVASSHLLAAAATATATATTTRTETRTATTTGPSSVIGGGAATKTQKRSRGLQRLSVAATAAGLRDSFGSGTTLVPGLVPAGAPAPTTSGTAAGPGAAAAGSSGGGRGKGEARGESGTGPRRIAEGILVVDERRRERRSAR